MDNDIEVAWRVSTPDERLIFLRFLDDSYRGCREYIGEGLDRLLQGYIIEMRKKRDGKF